MRTCSLQSYSILTGVSYGSRTNIHWTQGFSVIQRCAHAVQGMLRVCWEVAPWRVESREQASTDLVIRMLTASKGEMHLKMKNMTC